MSAAPVAGVRRSSWRSGRVLTWLWWRHTYIFNLAHKPLCGRFQQDVLRLGRVHVCRSCTLVYGSAVLAGIALLLFGAPQGATMALSLAAILPILVLSYPSTYGRLPRPVKDLVRCATGVGVALVAAALLVGAYLAGTAGAVAFVVAYAVSLPAYRRWKRGSCDGCAELGRGVCSGYALQVDGARAYELAAEAYLLGSNHTVAPAGASAADAVSTS